MMAIVGTRAAYLNADLSIVPERSMISFSRIYQCLSSINDLIYVFIKA